MDFLRALDIRLFYVINSLPHTWASDVLGEVLSGFGYAWIVWLVIGSILFFRKERKDHWFWVPFFLALFLSYECSEIFFKQFFERVRPGVLEGVYIIGTLPESFSFPSTHATVAFACAYVFSRKEAHWVWMYGLALLVGLSRIYLGHHYPIDVIGGMVIGTGIGIVSSQCEQYLSNMKRTKVKSFSKKRSKRV